MAFLRSFAHCRDRWGSLTDGITICKRADILPIKRRFCSVSDCTRGPGTNAFVRPRMILLPDRACAHSTRRACQQGSGCGGRVGVESHQDPDARFKLVSAVPTTPDRARNPTRQQTTPPGIRPEGVGSRMFHRRRGGKPSPRSRLGSGYHAGASVANSLASRFRATWSRRLIVPTGDSNSSLISISEWPWK